MYISVYLYRHLPSADIACDIGTLNLVHTYQSHAQSWWTKALQYTSHARESRRVLGAGFLGTRG